MSEISGSSIHKKADVKVKILQISSEISKNFECIFMLTHCVLFYELFYFSFNNYILFSCTWKHH